MVIIAFSKMVAMLMIVITIGVCAVVIGCPKHISCSHGDGCNGIYNSGDDDCDDHCNCTNEHDIHHGSMFCFVNHDHTDCLFVGARLLLGLFLLLCLELIKDVTHMISILTLLEEKMSGT
jgi:hypothetical protein